MTYTPAPLDTQPIALPPELEALLERLARNVHEVWAQQRIQDGWQHGTTRNDERKTHPSLVPYDELPESEKVYDRRTVCETLKVILALDYRILPPGA